MKNIFCFACVCLISLMSAAVVDVTNVDGSEVEDENVPKDSMFADVIKNITRVNNVLQDLIKNYERLQKIYHSQESLENYSNESEGGGDEMFRDGAKKGNDTNKTPSSTNRSVFPGTKMFGSVSAESNETKAENKNKKTVPKMESLIAKDADTKDTDKIKNINTKGGKKTDAKVDSGSSEAESDNSELELNLGGKSGNSPVHLKLNIARNSDQKEKSGKNNKATLRSAIATPNDTQTNVSAGSAIKKQIIQTETFAPNKIWSEIESNKPLNVKKEQEIVYSKQVTDKNDFRRNPDKKQKHHTTKNKTPSTPTNISLTSTSVENDNGIKKFQFQTMILRKAYGDACLKVVIRKCYKALSKAINEYYKSKQCKADFKSTFVQYSKTGCVQEFDEKPNNSETENGTNGTNGNGTENGNRIKKVPVKKRAQQLNDDFLDLTRNGYLASVCLPDNPQQWRRSMNVSSRKPPTEPKIKEDIKLKVLRDRFEKECQKASQLKCFKACMYATDQTCSTHVCQGDRKKNLLKYCKKECKISYKVESKSSESYDSSDTSSSSDSSSTSSSSFEVDLTRTTQKDIERTEPMKLFPLRTHGKKRILRQRKPKSQTKILIGKASPVS